MALLWMDGFDHYGNTPDEGRTNALSGAWAEMDSFAEANKPEISSDHADRGTYSLKFPNNNLNSALYAQWGRARRLFGADKTTVGVAFKVYFPDLPFTDNRVGMSLRSSANLPLLTLCIQSDGAIEVYDDEVGETSLGRTGQVIVAASFQQIETKVVFSATVGTVEVRVDGVVVLNLSGLNIGAAGAAGVAWHQTDDADSGDAAIPWYIDSVFAWDSAGTNNTFLGPYGVYTLMPTADTAIADWTKSAGVDGFALIDEVPPNTTDYIEAIAAGDESQFAYENLPGDVVSVKAVQTTPMIKKSDTGLGNVQVSIFSDATYAAGADRPVTTAYVYYHDVHDLDPDGAVAWTPTAVNALQVMFDRTS